MAGGGAVWNHRDRQRGGMGGIVQNLDVEYGGQAAKPLSADAQRVNFLHQLEPQFLDPGQRCARGGLAIG